MDLIEIGFYFILGGLIFVAIFSFVYWCIHKIRRSLKRKYTPERAKNFKCIDGHVVRSKGEALVDNHLSRLGIAHEYEDTIRVRGNKIKYDWFLPKYKVYLEYWGFFGKNYMRRKEEKLRLYRKGNLNLISIEDVMLEDIYSHLEHQLKRYIKVKKNKKVVHCPNCGIELDRRVRSP
jgi:predicted nuclease of restriction endonuclease-like RecB superfamily